MRFESFQEGEAGRQHPLGRLAVPPPASDRALCTEQPCWTRVCQWRDRTLPNHCRPWLLSPRMVAWIPPSLVGGWQRAGLTLVPCPPVAWEKHQEKKKWKGASTLLPPGQPRSGWPLSPWARLAHPPVGALAHVLPPVAAHKQILSFTYYLTQKEEKWIHMTVDRLTM